MLSHSTKFLTNLAENDEYVPCAGEISIRCYTIGVQDWRLHDHDRRLFLDEVKCWNKLTPTCNSPIQRHLNAVLQAFGKHLKKHDPLGEILQEITQ